MRRISHSHRRRAEALAARLRALRCEWAALGLPFARACAVAVAVAVAVAIGIGAAAAPAPARAQTGAGADASPVEASAGAFRILDARALVPPFVDGAPSCLASLAPLAARDTRSPVSAFEELAARTRRARREDMHRLRETLQRRIDESVNTLVQACLHIESARVQLRIGFGPETLAELARAEKSLAPAEWLPSMRDTARYYRAEARILVGLADPNERADLQSEFVALGDSAYRSVAAAARLRNAELALRDDFDEFDVERAGVAWKDLRERLEQARELQLGVHTWAPLAAEVALRAGHLSEAHHWLALAEGQPSVGDLAAIRKADVLIQLERRDEAGSTLRRVLGAARSAPARDLAAFELARHALVTGGSDERIALLERATRSRNPTVSLLARERLTRALLERGDIDAALVQLRELAHAEQDEIVAPLYPRTLDRALDAAVDGSECPRVLGRLASSWEFYLRAASRDEVFTRLGDCYLEVGMGSDALAVFRGVVRRFGADSVPDVSWRVARASLDAGELPSARAALRAHTHAGHENGAIDSEQSARWQWLAARLAHMEGRDDEARRLWLALARSKRLPPDLRGSVELELIRLWNTRDDELFEEVLRASLEEPAWVDPGLRAQVRVQLGDRSWQTGRRREARALYREALPEADAANARARAHYRSALEAGSNDAVRDELHGAGGSDPRASWSRLARIEGRMMDLRQAVGRPAQVAP